MIEEGNRMTKGNYKDFTYKNNYVATNHLFVELGASLLQR